MLEAPEEVLVSAEDGVIGPDLFGYYACEVAELLCQGEDLFPDPQSSERSKGKHEELGEKRTNGHFKGARSFVDYTAAGLSDIKREKLKTLLRQCVKDLTPEVEEMLQPVLHMCQLQSQLGSKHSSSNASVASDGDAKHVCGKKPRSSSSSSSASIPEPGSPNNSMCGEVNNDLEIILGSDIKDAEEVVKKYSDELLLTLDRMEKQLEKLLDSVMSTCRPLTRGEKRDLQKLIQKLPSRNLDRIIEIIQYHTLSGRESREEVFVDLERQDNVTLWRLYFYVNAVKNARKLVG